MEFTGKTVLITGASSGIGRELALRISKDGAKLILLARRKNLLEALSAQITGNGGSSVFYECDVSDRNNVRKVFGEIANKHGNINAAILNSGVSARTSLETVDSKIAEVTFNINVMGLIYCVEALTGSILKTPPSIIAGVSSLADGRGFPKSGFYCASKAAASIYLESLRIELAQKGIKVITIKPGFVKTPMTDKNEFEMPFIMPVDKAVEIIYNGLVKEKRIIQFPFPIVFETYLLKLLPNSLFDFFALKHLKQIGNTKGQK